MLCRLRPSGERPSEIGYKYPWSLPVVGHIMGVFLTEHPLSRWGLVLPKAIGHGWSRRDSYHTEATSMQRQQNTPNWFQPVTVYRKGESEPIHEFQYEQVWDGSVRGHRHLRAAIVATVEGLRDLTGLDYILWSPVTHGGSRVPLADKQHISIG